MSQIIIIIIKILRDRVGLDITGDHDWNAPFSGFGNDKDRLPFQVIIPRNAKKSNIVSTLCVAVYLLSGNRNVLLSLPTTQPCKESTFSAGFVFLNEDK